MGKKCRRGYEIRVLSSMAGSYIGTTDEEGMPNCRISEYYPKPIVAQLNLDKGLGMLFRAENDLACPDCSGYGSDIWKR